MQKVGRSRRFYWTSNAPGLRSREKLVPGHIIKYLGDAMTRCTHGYTVLNHLAKIDMVADRMPIEVEAAVSKTLPVPILLGINVK